MADNEDEGIALAAEDPAVMKDYDDTYLSELTEKTSLENGDIFLARGTDNQDYKIKLAAQVDSKINGALANYGKVYKMNKGLQGLGWYRIAEVNCGVHGFNIKLNLSATYENNEPCGKEISISQGWSENGVTVVTSTDKVPLFQKIRISRGGSGATRKAIIDVYYGSSVVNTVFVNITSPEENITLIDFTKITEEVSGNEYDIRTDLKNDISPLITYKYGTSGEINSQDGLIQAVISSFNAVSNYTSFSGTTTQGQEGYWRGFKHSSYGQGFLLSRGKLYFFLIQDGNVTTRKVMELMS